MKTTFILLLLYWGSERSSMVAPEFNSRESCEVAVRAAKKEFTSAWSAVNGAYAVCVEK